MVLIQSGVHGLLAAAGALPVPLLPNPLLPDPLLPKPLLPDPVVDILKL